MKLNFVPAQQADRPFYVRAHHSAYRLTIEKMFGWDADVQDQFAHAAFASGNIHIIWRDGHKVGVVGWARHADHIWLSELYVLPDYQGRGIGSAVLGHVKSMARACGCGIKLRTLKANTGAKDLYMRHGFDVTGVTDIHWNMTCGTA